MSLETITITWLPVLNALPSNEVVTSFAGRARNVVNKVAIDYEVDRQTNQVSVTHRYLDHNDQPVTTFAGLQPLHWKNTQALTAEHKVRSARGITKYAETSEFTYSLPYVGVLPSLPAVSRESG